MNTIVTPLKKSISMLSRIFVICLFLQTQFGFAQASLLLTNAHLHLGNGKAISQGQILIKGADILWVGESDEECPHPYSELKDLEAKHVYPGFIAPATAAGLVEVEAVRATVDFREVGRDNPNARTAIAFNTDSRIHPTIRYNGVLLVQSTPEGGSFSGLSSVMRLDARNWEEAVVRMDDGMHINWPNPQRFDRSKGKLVVNEKYAEQVRHIVQTFTDAKAYLRSNRKPINLKLEAFTGMFDGEKRAYIHANNAGAMLEAINEISALGVQHIVIVGGADAPIIAEFLREKNVGVILRRTHELPVRADDPVDLPFSTPKILHEAGVLFCLSNIGRMPVMGNRNLPFMAGTATTYGLPKEEAVAMITGNAAKIMGIDKRYGTLEAGKSATLIISTGDALDAPTQNIEYAWIDGVPVSMENWQEDLHNRWMQIVPAAPSK